MRSILPSDHMLLYAAEGPLDWQLSEHAKNALAVEVYEGTFLIVPSGNRYALRLGQHGKWERIAEGATLEEVKDIAEITAADSNARRKRFHPKAWEEAARKRERTLQGRTKK